MCDIIWKPLEVKHKITDPHLYDVIRQVLPIYSTSDFFVEIAGLRAYSKDVTVTGLGSFLYKNNVLFKHIPHNKVESSKDICECCRRTGHLADYGFAVVDNKHANRFYLIFLNENDTFANYTCLPDPAELRPAQRQELFASLKALADEGIFVPLHSIFYNKSTGGFSLFHYSEVIIDRSGNDQQKQEYMDLHKKILLL
jgi:hypothetical protein